MSTAIISCTRAVVRRYSRLERHAGRLARAVLRGRGVSNDLPLPDTADAEITVESQGEGGAYNVSVSNSRTTEWHYVGGAAGFRGATRREAPDVHG